MNQKPSSSDQVILVFSAIILFMVAVPLTGHLLETTGVLKVERQR